MANTPPSAKPSTIEWLEIVEGSASRGHVVLIAARVEAELLLGSADLRQRVARQLGDLEAVLDLHHHAVHRCHGDVDVVGHVRTRAAVEVPRLAEDVAGEVGDAAERLVDALLGDLALDPEQGVGGDAPGEVAHLGEARAVHVRGVLLADLVHVVLVRQAGVEDVELGVDQELVVPGRPERLGDRRVVGRRRAGPDRPSR